MFNKNVYKKLFEVDSELNYDIWSNDSKLVCRLRGRPRTLLDDN